MKPTIGRIVHYQFIRNAERRVPAGAARRGHHRRLRLVRHFRASGDPRGVVRAQPNRDVFHSRGEVLRGTEARSLELATARLTSDSRLPSCSGWFSIGALMGR